MEAHDSLRNELWHLLEKSRKSHNIGDFEIFEQWITSGDSEQLELRLSVWNDIMKNNWRQNNGEFISKPDVAEFITDLIGNNTYKRVLDPACGVGYLLSKAKHQVVEQRIFTGLKLIKEYRHCIEITRKLQHTKFQLLHCRLIR